MIGTTLKKLRGIYGYSATDLARELNISKSYLSEIEHCNKEPSLDLLIKYSNLMGIKVSSLMMFSEKYELAESKGYTYEFTKSMMSKLIDSMSEFSDNHAKG